MTTRARTIADCEQIRSRCAGRRAVPLPVVVTIAVVLFGVIIGSHAKLEADASATAAQAAATRTELRLRSEQLAAMERKLDALLSAVSDLRTQMTRMERREEPSP